MLQSPIVEPIIDGIPIIVLIFGLVEFSKKFGLSGNGCLALSMALGIVLGMLFQLSLGMPTSFAGWLLVVVYGLTLGLTCSGFYDWSNKRMPARE